MRNRYRQARISTLLCSCVFAIIPLVLLPAIGARAQSGGTLDVNAKVHVTVAGEPDVSGDFVVDSDGNITMLYVNQVHVGGLTVEQARDRITTALAKYYRQPQVIITLTAAGGISISITGAVTTQGDSLVRADTHLNEVIQRAVPTLDADFANIQITHGVGNQIHPTDKINYTAFLDSGDPAGNPQLHDGDVIFVPRRQAVPISVNINGSVVKSGQMTLPAKSTALTAIQAAGGFTLDADRKAIVVQHASGASQPPFDYDQAGQQPENTDLNPVLSDGDTIIVPATTRPAVYTIGGAVTKPMEYPMDQPSISLATAIGRAGGPIENAKMDQIQIIRNVNGKSKCIKVNAAKDPGIEGTTMVEAGDNIVIPQGSPHSGPDLWTFAGIAASLAGVLRL